MISPVVIIVIFLQFVYPGDSIVFGGHTVIWIDVDKMILKIVASSILFVPEGIFACHFYW